MEGENPTRFEWVLFAWLCLNTIIGFGLILGGGESINLFGSGWAVWMPFAIFAFATCILLWRLLTPTWIVLGVASVYCLLQVVTVHLPGAAYGFQLGLCLNIRVSDDPNFIVKINLIGIVGGFLYGLAAYRRFEEYL